jgi:hypothetical protein
VADLALNLSLSHLLGGNGRSQPTVLFILCAIHFLFFFFFFFFSYLGHGMKNEEGRRPASCSRGDLELGTDLWQ